MIQKNKNLYDTLGWNYRMTSLQAAMGLVQLKKLNKFIKIKSIGNFYNNALKFKRFSYLGKNKLRKYLLGLWSTFKK